MGVTFPLALRKLGDEAETFLSVNMAIILQKLLKNMKLEKAGSYKL